MTLHTMRGAIGIMKEIYDFHANVVSSSDMSIFLMSSNNCYGQIAKVQELKNNSLQKMKLSFLGFLTETDKTDIVSNIYLADVMWDFLQFTDGIMDSTELVIKEPRINLNTCIWEEETDPQP